MMLPGTGKFLILIVLGMGWMLLCRRALQLNGDQPYHLAAYHRDRRKARFYYMSVWVALVAAFLSSLCLEALAVTNFDSSLQREWVLGVLRGLGLWGLMIIALVWTQVGQRVSQMNSDGQSLIPEPERKKQNRE